MGTPDLNLRGAMKLFSRIGLDGIEVRCAKDGQIDTTTVDDDLLQLANQWQREYGCPIVCLTPYFKDFVSEERNIEIARMKRAVDVAARLGCSLVRAYGGIDPADSQFDRAEIWEKTATGLREIGVYAADQGVRLCVETHAQTLTVTARDTRAMVDDVNLPTVGILFDPAWIVWAREETTEEALSALNGKIFHCHYKDFKLLEEKPQPAKRTCLLGEGDVPWPEIVAGLKDAGYDGALSDEYEKYWNPDDLPETEVGMSKNRHYLKQLLSSL